MGSSHIYQIRSPFWLKFSHQLLASKTVHLNNTIWLISHMSLCDCCQLQSDIIYISFKSLDKWTVCWTMCMCVSVLHNFEINFEPLLFFSRDRHLDLIISKQFRIFELGIFSWKWLKEWRSFVWYQLDSQ